MLIAAAVCPHPPLLVPAVAAGAADELEELRAACDLAVRALTGTDPDRLVVVGDAPRTGGCPPAAVPSLRPYGVDAVLAPPARPGHRDGAGSAPPVPPVLPLAHTVAAWLLERAGWRRPWSAYGVSAQLGAAECRGLGASLVEGEERVALLVMGDGSARRGVKAPGYLDSRAEDFDSAVAKALADADPAALSALDPALAADLLAAGRASWQVLAGAAGGRRYLATLGYDGAPYGVGYLVATWSLGDWADA